MGKTGCARGARAAEIGPCRSAVRPSRGMRGRRKRDRLGRGRDRSDTARTTPGTGCRRHHGPRRPAVRLHPHFPRARATRRVAGSPRRHGRPRGGPPVGHRARIGRPVPPGPRRTARPPLPPHPPHPTRPADRRRPPSCTAPRPCWPSSKGPMSPAARSRTGVVPSARVLAWPSTRPWSGGRRAGCPPQGPKPGPRPRRRGRRSRAGVRPGQDARAHLIRHAGRAPAPAAARPTARRPRPWRDGDGRSLRRTGYRRTRSRPRRGGKPAPRPRPYGERRSRRGGTEATPPTRGRA